MTAFRSPLSLHPYSDPHERIMARALRLASRGRHASPNPMVGCVLISPDGAVVGAGFHPRAGEPHAEVWALRSAAPGAARGATAYVTLEPCSHCGRTPPCSLALVEAGVSSVVIAMLDPDTRVSGRGVEILRNAGIDVTLGVLEREARELSAAYIKHRTTGLPWFVLKTAASLDGKIATRSGDSQWITSPPARRAVHRQLRDRCDAIVTGLGTVIADDPSLTTRLGARSGRNPWRIVVDSRGRTPLESRVVRQASVDGRTMIATTEQCPSEHRELFERAGCHILICSQDVEGRVSLPDLAARLGTRGDMIGVLIETGGQLAASALNSGIVDRWTAFLAPKVIGGDAAPGPIGGLGAAQMSDAQKLSTWKLRRCGPDIVIDARIW
ncbi:riboflavin biosynthesis protein RibD [Capsulimonas corticalis]|uniref:Riboflavin biosynthesis protein RibD n=1 Tax=Capsulimonas corticalis TaxID=2219043 RepID=A0A402CYQ7_9BACT|nr:bifunctional diaminohydroxyphosphoribosylaminopyrimidine deaminase/5-amino-6-(5-phosphoribosylamino)uracil reductase RibD [Capsulimonas corticalis]BDI31262.1 riboflavin biosynthesis protein RibD [Capsulimonas corticalis]